MSAIHALLEHYVIPDAKVGAATCSIYAFRCGNCNEDFHIGIVPKYCPSCGTAKSAPQPFPGAVKK